MIYLLQFSQTRSIRRGDVEYKHICVVPQHLHRTGIIRRGALVRRLPRTADVCSHGNLWPHSRGSSGYQSVPHSSSARVVESHSIDQCPLRMGSEHPRLWISFLGESGDATILNPRESQGRPCAECLRSLIESRSQPKGMMEQFAENMYGELGGVIDCAESSLTNSALAERG